MPFSTWIRDAFGIHKDIVDTEKASLEIKKLEDEERARHLITPATMDDVERYDPKVKEMIRMIDRGGGDIRKEVLRTVRWPLWVLILLGLLLLALFRFVFHRL